MTPAKIVLTGAPGAGKSTVLRALAADPDLNARVGGITPVAEAATATYAARRTRWDRLDDAGRREVQRAIYRLQLAQEAAAERDAKAAGHGVILLDRGTLDGAAYWPDGPAAYWAELSTTAAAELARYDAVLLLESAAALGAYAGEAGNPTRFEDAPAALANGRRLAALWSAHARLRPVPAKPTVAEKVAAAAGGGRLGRGRGVRDRAGVTAGRHSGIARPCGSWAGWPAAAARAAASSGSSACSSRSAAKCRWSGRTSAWRSR